MNSELWNTNIKENQDIVRSRKRTTRYISNVLVLSDAKRPHYEGRVFLFSYGAKIFTKLMNAIEPEFEDEESFNPFDFWEGAPFKIKIRNVEGFRNYDKSEFGDCGPLFESDEALEKVWKSEYALKEFVSEKQFKPYEELKTKLYTILNSPSLSQTHQQASEDESRSEEPQPTQRPERVSAPSVSTSNIDDDDDFRMFSSLMDS